MSLDPGISLELEVVKESCRPKFFRVRTEDGQEFDLHKFKFQYGQSVPDSLICYVKQSSPNIILVQDLSVYIRNFYEVGKEYEFKVKTIKKTPNVQFILEDDKGLCFNLNNPSLNLSKGNIVKCRVSKIEDAKVNLKYVGTLTPRLPLRFMSIADWIKALKVDASPSYYFRLISKITEFGPIIQKYKEKDPTWILDILQECTTHLPQWLIKNNNKHALLARINRKLDIARKVCLFIIEESDYLRDCNQDQRNSLQSKLSNYAELFEQYGVATSKILSNTHEEFIDRMFFRLKEAGYLYKPDRQIRIMMTILKLRPELINSRMGELFETLHNWDFSNWNSEPFRGALVQQLQIFIEENYRKANLLAPNDSSADNKVISRLILALAVQRLLANEKDNIDLDVNRAILYRYNSNRNPGDVNLLLQKAIFALLGIEIPNEFSWEDTDQPPVLINKISNDNISEDYSDTHVVKTYSTSKLEVQLRENSLHLIAKDADPESTVIPNNMFDWLSPVISLAEDLNVKGGKKVKNLRDYKDLWEQIGWSIFGGEQPTEEPVIEKRLPAKGDEVKIIIDGSRINYSVHEKQRLQFHCKIEDELFYGEGWLPCDAIHMVGWLTDNNFDDSIKFAQDDQGIPLIFKAKVDYLNDGKFVFSLRESIDNYLLDTSFPGQENIAIVTAFDKNANAYICLSENGASYKISKDEDTMDDLHIGKIIRISYFEPDRSNYNSQYFIGTLSDNQSDLPATFNKNTSLFNLMQAIGQKQETEDEEDFQVVESQQIMSQEELVELIYIIRRRANSENEYIKAYNFLGLASLLAKAADESKLYDELICQMSLLEILQEFGKNKKVYPETLEQFKGSISNSPILERLFTRLLIVADLNVNESSSHLWQIKQNPRNETEGQLASLVLSYNLLPDEMEAPRKQIMTQITTLLNVNSTTVTSKYYGDESQITEFKSSIVYSAKTGGKPAPKDQLWEITHIICGFMNARGGRLYIGVNDAGYENGLDDDLAYRKNTGLKPTIDGMIVDLQNHLDRTLPHHAKDHFHIFSDPDSKKGVIIVEIVPVKQPVELDGVIYVRTSSVTKPRYGEERNYFIENRSMNYENIMKLWNPGHLTITDNNSKSKESADVNNQLNTTDSFKETTPNSLDIKSNNELTDIKIRTGRHRHNVLHDYEENYAEPAFYIYFNSNNTLILSTVDSYREHDDDCRLVLSIKQREADGLLINLKKDNSVAVMNISDLEEKDFDQPLSYNTNDLKAVNVGLPHDYLLSIIKAPNKGIFYRLDKLSEFPIADGINGDKNRKLCEHPHEILWQEIIHPDKLSFFESDSINKDNKTFGCPVPVGDGTLSDEQRIENLLKPVVE